jgi:hypothetical protein
MLTNAVISAAKPREKPFKMSDGGGLYLLVNPTGKRWWRLKFRVHGREKLLSLGVGIIDEIHTKVGKGFEVFSAEL